MKRLDLKSVTKNPVIAREILENFHRKNFYTEGTNRKNFFFSSLRRISDSQETPPPPFFLLVIKKGYKAMGA